MSRADLQRRRAAMMAAISNDNFTKLLLHLDSNLVDNSLTPKTITSPNGCSYVVGKFGNAVSLSSTSSQYLQAAYNADFVLASNEWTIELWVYLASKPTANGFIFSRRHYFSSTYNNVGYYMWIDSAGIISSVVDKSDKTRLNITPTTAIATSTWTHLALERDNNTGKITQYMNGTAVGSISIGTNSLYEPGSSIPFRIGCGTDGTQTTSAPAQFLTARFDEFRFTVGTARYRGNFTPPTVPFVA